MPTLANKPHTKGDCKMPVGKAANDQNLCACGCGTHITTSAPEYNGLRYTWDHYMREWLKGQEGE
jgi:hypothetical protein